MIIKMAWKHICSRPISGILTVAGATLVLTLLGSFWALKDNLSHVQSTSIETPSNVHVFIKTGTLNAEVKNVVAIMQGSTLLEQVRVVSSDEAFKEFENEFGETLSKAVSENALPIMITGNMIKGQIKRKDLNNLVEKLKKHPTVLDVDAGAALNIGSIESETEARVVNWAFVLFVLVFSIVALLISHLIRLAFEGNKEDIETMKVLGATKFWIFTPMLLEALFYGLVSSALTIITLNLSIQYILPAFANVLLPKNFDFFTLSISSWFGVIGVAIGASLLGAVMTWPLVRKPARRS